MSAGPQVRWDKPNQKKPHTPKVIWDREVSETFDIEPPSSLGFLANIPKSGGRLVSGVAGAIAHPIRTAKGLYSIAEEAHRVGMGQRVLTAKDMREMGISEEEIKKTGYLQDAEELKEEKPETPTLDAIKEVLRQRYGGVDEILGTLYRDPVGFAADIAGIFSGGGAAASKIGQVSKIGTLSKAGRALETAAKAIDPFRIAGAVARPLLRGTKNKWLILLGKTTGRGPEPFQVVTKLKPGSPGREAFKSAMRGGISEIEILDNFKDALAQARTIRGTKYRQQLAEISEFTQSLDISSIRTTLEKQLKQYGISRTPEGVLDFSRSTIHAATDQNRVRGILQDVYGWGKRQGDRTPLGLDTLKRRLDDFYSESGQSRALVRSVRGEVKKTLDNVPGYKEMTRDYAVASELIESVEKGLSLGGKAGQAALTKLQGALKENNAYRRVLVEALEQFVGDPTLKQQLAGSALASPTPHGLVGAMSAGAISAMIITGAINPKALIALATHSPRMMGEMMVALSAMRALSPGAKAGKILGTPGAYRALQIPAAAEREKEKKPKRLSLLEDARERHRIKRQEYLSRKYGALRRGR